MKLKAEILLLLFWVQFQAQGQSAYFNRTYNVDNWSRYASSVIEVADGFIVVGDKITTTYRGFVIMKLDLYGDTVWAKQYFIDPWKVYNVGLKSVIATGDGNYAFCGMTVDSADSGLDDVLLVKFDPNGDTLWTKRYGSPGAQELGMDCKQTPDGGYIIVGVTGSFGDPSGDIYLIKTDSAGNMEWDTTYGGPGKLDEATSIAVTNNGGYVISSYSETYGGNIWIITTNSTGDTVWTRTLNAKSGLAGSVIQSNDGGYLIASVINENTGNGYDGYLAKLDNSGNIVWQKTYVMPNNNWLEAVIELSNGDIAVAGTSRDAQNTRRGWLVKTNAVGDTIWTRTYSVPDSLANQFYDLRATSDSGFIMAGFAVDPVQDFWVVKTNCLGYEAPPQAGFRHTATDSLGRVFTDSSLNTGSWSWYFGDGASLYATWQQQPQNNFVHTYPDTGTYIVQLIAEACGDKDTLTDTIYVCPSPTAGFSYSEDSLTVSFTNQSQYSYGYLWDFGDGNFSADANPTHTYQDSGSYLVTLTAAACGDTGVFIDTALVFLPVGINNYNKRMPLITLAPNPFSRTTTITYHLPFSTERGTIAIYDMPGNPLDEYPVMGAGQIEYANKNLSPGIYFCHYIKNGRIAKTLKMVVVR